MSEVRIVPHDPRWRREFADEAARIAGALGEILVDIHHIGSTAIPEIYAKPVIDILVEVREISSVDARNSSMELLGYEVMGEFGIAGRRYFRKDNEHGLRTHQVHIFETGSDQVRRHLAFRDYLIAHPAEALAYSDLKRRLADQYPDSMDDYMDGKDAFIKEIDRRAADEFSRQCPA